MPEPKHLRLRWMKAFVILVFFCLAVFFASMAVQLFFKAVVRIASHESLLLNIRIDFQHIILPLIGAVLFLSVSTLLMRTCWIVAYRIGPSGQLDGDFGDRLPKRTEDPQQLPQAKLDAVKQNPYEAPRV